MSIDGGHLRSSEVQHENLKRIRKEKKKKKQKKKKMDPFRAGSTNTKAHVSSASRLMIGG